MRSLVILWSLIVLAAVPANAVVVPFSTFGPPSGFRQDFRLDFSAATVESASATLVGARTDFFYDASTEELSTSVIDFADSCSAPGTCVAFASAGLTIQPGSLWIRITTPRGFYSCEPLGSVEGVCGRSFAAPQLFVQAVVTGPGNGAFTLTASPPTAIPEPAIWFSLIGGVGLVGAVARRRRHHAGHCRIAA